MYGRVQTPECGFLVAGYDSIGVVLCTSESDSEISVEERSGKKDTVRHLLVSLALASTQLHKHISISQLAVPASCMLQLPGGTLGILGSANF